MSKVLSTETMSVPGRFPPFPGSWTGEVGPSHWRDWSLPLAKCGQFVGNTQVLAARCAAAGPTATHSGETGCSPRRVHCSCIEASTPRRWCATRNRRCRGRGGIGRSCTSSRPASRSCPVVRHHPATPCAKLER